AGTCFLDEIGEISPCVQAKLLRVLQEHEIKRVGGTDSVGVDVRVIAATNRDLGALIDGGRFREDLFYRLSVVTLQIPPLRDRREDIPLLADHFLRVYSTANGRRVSEIAPEAMALMVAYDWPGNIRELEHAIERAVALTTSLVVRPEDLPPKCAGTVPTSNAPGAALSLRGVVTRHVHRVLREARWNKKLAAQLLGIHRRTHYGLTKRYGISLSERERRVEAPDELQGDNPATSRTIRPRGVPARGPTGSAPVPRERRVELRETAAPEPKAGEILVRVRAAALEAPEGEGGNLVGKNVGRSMFAECGKSPSVG